VKFLWERFGHEALLDAHAAQIHTFSQWRPKTWHKFADERWWETERNGITCGSIRIHAFFQNNAWFCAWWNNMRSAFAMARYAIKEEDAGVREKAGKILNMALDAPRDQGAFPVVLWETEKDGQIWIRDHHFGGIPDCYHAFDMAWTGYWLLRWHNELDSGDDRILPRCVALGDFFRRQQQANGFIPSYFNEDLSVREDTRLNQVSSEPAGCAVFLVELYRTVGDRKYLESAIKAVEYLQKHIMGTIQAAKAFLAVFDATKEERFLEQGMNVLDYLSLTQQVWTHPIMSPNLIGGFTTQNTDAEWSDARQAYCAVVYLDYFDRTGNLEYLERGIAALRSGFPVAPYENWSHTGFHDNPGVLSGFHWGQGSALASVELVWDRFGDVLADTKRGWAYGVNGCTVRDFAVSKNSVSLKIDTELEWDQPLRIVFRTAPEGMSTVTVNGSTLGSYSGDTLRQGVHWTVGK
jgi:hypothetical protein